MLFGKVIDGDGHALEPPALWQQYLETKCDYSMAWGTGSLALRDKTGPCICKKIKWEWVPNHFISQVAAIL
jgi:hypothetical protein